MPFIRSRYLIDFITILLFVVLTAACPKSCCLCQNLRSFAVKEIHILRDLNIIIDSISNCCCYMMLIYRNITSITGSIRLDGPVRTLLCTIICRLPRILCSFISILMCICTRCVQKMVSVIFQILCSLRKYP